VRLTEAPPCPVTWLVHRERLLLLGWGRAILLQFAHPLIAHAVFEHSGFRRDPFGGWQRLHRTVRAMLWLTFGSDRHAALAADRINAIHARVKGRANDVPYSANDPDLMRWVHLTCVDSFLRTYELYVEPLTLDQRDAYCAESAQGAAALGLPPSRLPCDFRGVQDAMAVMLESGVLTVTDTARALARAVLHPRPGWLGWPFVGAVRLSTIAMLPASLREAYGLPWTSRDERRLVRLVALVRTLRRRTPSRVAHWAIARQAIARRAKLVS
jgi:uncharacterized protein (DUF2236 family)